MKTVGMRGEETTSMSPPIGEHERRLCGSMYGPQLKLGSAIVELYS